MAQPDTPILQAAIAAPGWVESVNEKADAFSSELQNDLQSLQNYMTDLQSLLDGVIHEITDLTEECDEAHTELQTRFDEIREELAKSHTEIEAAEEKTKEQAAQLTERIAELDAKLESTMGKFDSSHADLIASEHQMSKSLDSSFAQLAAQANELPIRITNLTVAAAVATVQADEAAPAFREGVLTLQEHVDAVIEAVNAAESASATEFADKLQTIDTELFLPSKGMAEHVGEVLDKEVVEPFRTQAEIYSAKYLELAAQFRAKIEEIGDATEDVSSLQKTAQDLSSAVDDYLTPVQKVFDKLGIEWPGI